MSKLYGVLTMATYFKSLYITQSFDGDSFGNPAWKLAGAAWRTCAERGGAGVLGKAKVLGQNRSADRKLEPHATRLSESRGMDGIDPV